MHAGVRCHGDEGGRRVGCFSPTLGAMTGLAGLTPREASADVRWSLVGQGGDASEVSFSDLSHCNTVKSRIRLWTFGFFY